MLLPPDQWQVVAEYALTREPRRIDAVIVRRVDVRDWHPEYLRSLLDDLLPHNLVHFKGATDDLERTDAPQLLSYAYQYMALEGLQSPADISLRVVAPTLTPRFLTQLEALDGVLVETAERGVSRRPRAGLRAAGGGDQRRMAQPGGASLLRRVARVLAAAWCSWCAR
jgi:hypothetical protein